MIEKNTMLDTLIERRNVYQRNLADEMVNVLFFGHKLKEALKGKKKGNQDKVNAENSIANAQKAVKNFKLIIQSFDELIALEKKNA
jgi:hypothetical protein